MVCRFDDLRCKEIINIKTGCKLGYADDLEFETCTAKILKLIVYGKPKFFGLCGREEDFFIPWCNIEVIGEDTILVSCDSPHRPKSRESFLKSLLK